jgi:hypothetical protein
MYLVTNSIRYYNAWHKKRRGFGYATNPRQGATHITYYHAGAWSVVLCVQKLVVFGVQN